MTTARASSEGSGRPGATRRAFYVDRDPSSTATSTSARTSSSVVRKLTKHGRSPILPSTVAGATHTRPSSCSVRTSAPLCPSRSASRPARGGRGRSRAAACRRAARAHHAPRRGRRAAAPGARLFSTASRNAWAPCARNASQSLSARKGREYSSVMSTVCGSSRSCGMYASSCANAAKRSSRRADEQDAAGLRQEEPLVRVERDRVGALERRRTGGRSTGPPPPAARTRRRRAARRPRSTHTSASASIGSTAPVSVVPAVATTATGTRPAARSARIASATRPGRSRRSPSIGERAHVRRSRARGSPPRASTE